MRKRRILRLGKNLYYNNGSLRQERKTKKPPAEEKHEAVRSLGKARKGPAFQTWQRETPRVLAEARRLTGAGVGGRKRRNDPGASISTAGITPSR